MAYRGRYFLGDEIPLGVLTTDSSGVPALPDACPTMKIYSSTGQVTQGWLPGGLGGTSSLVPVLDRYGATGLFGVRLLLGPAFSTGLYTVKYSWTVSAVRGAELDTFEVLPGGDIKGNAISMFFHRQAQADFIVREQDSGRLLANRNPST